MAGALCTGSTLSPHQGSLILLLTQTGFLMEGLKPSFGGKTTLGIRSVARVRTSNATA
jgi:hypothetical protein